jgi:hypothetical protein
MKGLTVKFVGEFEDGQHFYLEKGQLALVTHPGTIERDWWLRCYCGSGGILRGHTVESVDPVNITPSIRCPGGCHYYIRGGVIV